MNVHDPSGSVAQPVALYEGPKLTWFRGWSLVALVVTCVLAGAGLREALWRVDLASRLQQHAVLPSSAPQHVHATLKTPSGGTVTLPSGRVTVVNVWLQGCPDCMETFRAFSALQQHPLWSRVDVVNVAYGQADPNWAHEYGVDLNLAFDPGDQIVQPLGIGTFTTFVIDGQGRVVFRGRAVEPAFVERIAAVIDAMEAIAPGPSFTSAPIAK